MSQFLRRPPSNLLTVLRPIFLSAVGLTSMHGGARFQVASSLASCVLFGVQSSHPALPPQAATIVTRTNVNGEEHDTT
jgi:hypothetical protein